MLLPEVFTVTQVLHTGGCILAAEELATESNIRIESFDVLKGNATFGTSPITVQIRELNGGVAQESQLAWKDYEWLGLIAAAVRGAPATTLTTTKANSGIRSPIRALNRSPTVQSSLASSLFYGRICLCLECDQIQADSMVMCRLCGVLPHRLGLLLSRLLQSTDCAPFGS